MLTGKEIARQIELGRITISPFDQRQLNANSYDVRLAPMLYRVLTQQLDFRQPYEVEELTIGEDGLVLKPGELYLGVTVERTHTPHHIPEYSGKSTTGRYFLVSHMTAGFGDIGFDGHWTLEIMVGRHLRVYPNQRIGQICFSDADGEIGDNIYKGRYNTIQCRPKCGVPNNV